MPEHENLEARIGALEAAVQAQAGQLKTAYALLAQEPNIFKSPWERFLDGPDAGLFVDPARHLQCVVGCARRLREDLEAADDDAAAVTAALSAFSDCRRRCDGF